jgi:hypothetical protein
MRTLANLKRRLALWLLKLVCTNEQGGLSLGGPGTNTLRDIFNTINSGGGVPADPLDSVQFHNPQGSFDGSANFRFKDSSSQGVLIGQNFRLNLSENGGPADVYLRYNSTNDYFEIYTDDAIRAQF